MMNLNLNSRLVDFNKMLSKNKTFISITALLYFLPLLTTNADSSLRSTIFLLTTILIFGLLTLSFELQLGRSGLLNFGHAALFGVGAYSATFFISYIEDLNLPVEVIINLGPIQVPLSLFLSSIWIVGIFFAMSVGILLGIVMGLTTNRMRGTSFAFIALAIAMVIHSFFVENPDISGGETGLPVPTPLFLTSKEIYIIFCLIITPIILILFLLAVGKDFKERRGFLGFTLYPDPLEDPKYTENKNITISFLKSNARNIKLMLYLIFILIFFIIILIVVLPNVMGMLNAPGFRYTIPIDYYLVLTCCILAFIYVKKLVNAPFGRVLSAISQNEERARALGYNVYVYKIKTLAVSGGIAALAGALFAPTNYNLTPDIAVGVGITIDVMIYSIVGGLNTLFGPFLGAALVIISESRLSEILNVLNISIFDIKIVGEWWIVILGVLYILIVLFFPFGIVGTFQVHSRKIATFLRKLRITESDYWWIALIIAIASIYFLINFNDFIDFLKSITNS